MIQIKMNEEEKNAIEIVKGLAVYYDDYSLLDEEEIKENESVNKSIELILNLIEKLQKENKKLKANHIITHNKVSDEEKAKIFDVIDNSIDTYFEKTKPYWVQIMTKDKMSLEEAETIINDMYQDRNKILENNNVIDISRINDVIFSNLEFASVIVLREIQSLERKLENSIPVSLVKDKIRKNEEIIDISNDGDLIHELLQKNKVYEELLESEE